MRFNPHRPRRAGATCRPVCPIWPICGFQSSPAPKGRCYSQPRKAWTPSSARFNPHRPRRAGATTAARWSIKPPAGFNPHRPRRAGATFCLCPLCVRPQVSILTGPEGPVLQDSAQVIGGTECFNPHRPRRAGATCAYCGHSPATVWFQSSPAPKGRCYIQKGAQLIQKGMFQSSPAPKGRCYPPFSITAIRDCVFQSSPAPKGRCYYAALSTASSACCFNPHRPRRAGATRRHLAVI